MDRTIRRHLMGRGVSSEVENPRDAAWNRKRTDPLAADAHARQTARRNLDLGVIDPTPAPDPQHVAANRLRAWAFGDDYARRCLNVPLDNLEKLRIQRLALKIKLSGGQPFEG